MLTLTKTFEFAASHRLSRPVWDEATNFKVYGKCANPNGHGHNYRMEVTVYGRPDAETGMVMDAGKLDALVTEYVLSEVDHKDLDRDVAWLKGRVSTVENIVDAIWDRLEVPISNIAHPTKLQRVKVWETGRIYATREES